MRHFLFQICQDAFHRVSFNRKIFPELDNITLHKNVSVHLCCINGGTDSTGMLGHVWLVHADEVLLLTTQLPHCMVKLHQDWFFHRCNRFDLLQPNAHIFFFPPHLQSLIKAQIELFMTCF